MTRSILFVCLGNICRSPTAEGVLRALSTRADLDLRIDSAGTAGWHIGNPPHDPAIGAARARAYDLSSLRARQIVAGDFNRFDLIIGMDAQNIADIEALRPTGNQTPVQLFLDYADVDDQAVPDPYYTRDYEGALDLIEAASRGLITAIGGSGQPQ